MLDSNKSPSLQRDPWNKGRLIGQKRPLKPKDVWSIRVRLQMEHRGRDLAMFNLAIDSKLRGCDLVRLQVDVSVPAAGSGTAPPSFRRRRDGRSSSKSPNRPEPQSRRGFSRLPAGRGDTSSRAASRHRHTYRRGNTRGSFMAGSRVPGWIARPTARIRCAGQRRRRSTRRRATFARSSCSSGIRSWKAPSVTWASRWMTRSPFPSKSSCKPVTAATPSPINEGRSPSRAQKGRTGRPGSATAMIDQPPTAPRGRPVLVRIAKTAML